MRDLTNCLMCVYASFAVAVKSLDKGTQPFVVCDG